MIEKAMHNGEEQGEVLKLASRATVDNIFKMDDLKNRFSYHSPKDGQAEKYAIIRAELLRVAIVISDLCPEGREKSSAFTHLEEAMFFANASIARKE